MERLRAQAICSLLRLRPSFDQWNVGMNMTVDWSDRGNEMFVSRKTKSITKASVDLALEKIIELSGEVAGPKKLKCFGASYLYPIFIEMGLIKNS